MDSNLVDRCPLCGGYPHDRYRACDNPKCELPEKNWSRVRELVAIRDAAVEYHWNPQPNTYEKLNRLLEVTRQEAEKGAKDVR